MKYRQNKRMKKDGHLVIIGSVKPAYIIGLDENDLKKFKTVTHYSTARQAIQELSNYHQNYAPIIILVYDLATKTNDMIALTYSLKLILPQSHIFIIYYCEVFGPFVKRVAGKLFEQLKLNVPFELAGFFVNKIETDNLLKALKK